MPQDQGKCWFFTATTNWNLPPSHVCDEFRTLIDEARLARCSAGLDIVAFSFDENNIFAERAKLSGLVHSTQQIRRVTVESWIKHQHIIMEWTVVHGSFHQAPLIRKFLDESDEAGITAGLKRRINYLGDCAAPLKKAGRLPCPYKPLSDKELRELVHKRGGDHESAHHRKQLLAVLRQLDAESSGHIARARVGSQVHCRCFVLHQLILTSSPAESRSGAPCYFPSRQPCPEPSTRAREHTHSRAVLGFPPH